MSTEIYFQPDKLIPFDDTKLHSTLKKILREKMSFTGLYEIQSMMLSHISRGDSFGNASDLVLCAPTGSGKTLAYALPIVQRLMNCIMPRLRAIIVVPTRDLALQVSQVFQCLSNPVGLCVGLITGAASIVQEKQSIDDCDILVATPGRLTYHVQHTSTLDLTHVRYLILDESDRLLQESYDHWLSVLMPRLGNPPPKVPEDSNTCYRPLTGVLALAIVPSAASMASSDYATASDERIRKILVSATHSQNPTYMVHLDMRHPIMFRVKPSVTSAVHKISGEGAMLKERFNVPATLSETAYVVKEIQEKPAALLHLLGWTKVQTGNHAINGVHRRDGGKLIFTHSTESAHRLCRLLELCAYALHRAVPIFEMSGELSAERRREVVKFTKNSYKDDNGEEAPIIVCSDLLSRGMDIFTIDCVINYDSPVHIRTYLHRAGRTARAGRSGSVITLLLAKQVRHFRMMIHEAERGEKLVKTFNLYRNDFFTNDVQNLLSRSLLILRRVLQREKLNLLHREQQLPRYAVFELYTHCNTSSEINSKESDWNFTRGEDIDRELHANVGTKRERASIDEGEPLSTSNVDEENTKEQEESLKGDDGISELLYAQIARNLLS